MSQDFKIQQNVKVGNDLINLRADNPAQFQELAEWTVANAALFVNVQAALGAVPPALAGNVTNTQVINEAPAQAVQQQQPQSGGWAQPQPQAAPSWSQPGTPPQGSGQSTIETDKWNNGWEYDLPNAPLTPRGPAVLKHGTSKAGKPFKKWEDPAAGPRWFNTRQPKVEPSARWEGAWVND